MGYEAANMFADCWSPTNQPHTCIPLHFDAHIKYWLLKAEMTIWNLKFKYHSPSSTHWPSAIASLLYSIGLVARKTLVNNSGKCTEPLH